MIFTIKYLTDSKKELITTNSVGGNFDNSSWVFAEVIEKPPVPVLDMYIFGFIKKDTGDLYSIDGLDSEGTAFNGRFNPTNILDSMYDSLRNTYGDSLKVEHIKEEAFFNIVPSPAEDQKGFINDLRDDAYSTIKTKRFNVCSYVRVTGVLPSIACIPDCITGIVKDVEPVVQEIVKNFSFKIPIAEVVSDSSVSISLKAYEVGLEEDLWYGNLTSDLESVMRFIATAGGAPSIVMAFGQMVGINKVDEEFLYIDFYAIGARDVVIDGVSYSLENGWVFDDSGQIMTPKWFQESNMITTLYRDPVNDTSKNILDYLVDDLGNYVTQDSVVISTEHFILFY